MRSWVYTFTAHFPGFNLFRLNGICRLQRFFLFLSRALIFSSVRSSLFARQNHGKPTKIFMTYHFTRFLPSFVFFIRHEMPLSFFIPHLFTFFPILFDALCCCLFGCLSHRSRFPSFCLHYIFLNIHFHLWLWLASKLNELSEKARNTHEKPKEKNITFKPTTTITVDDDAKTNEMEKAKSIYINLEKSDIFAVWLCRLPWMCIICIPPALSLILCQSLWTERRSVHCVARSGCDFAYFVSSISHFQLVLGCVVKFCFILSLSQSLKHENSFFFLGVEAGYFHIQPFSIHNHVVACVVGCFVFVRVLLALSRCGKNKEKSHLSEMWWRGNWNHFRPRPSNRLWNVNLDVFALLMLLMLPQILRIQFIILPSTSARQTNRRRCDTATKQLRHSNTFKWNAKARTLARLTINARQATKKSASNKHQDIQMTNNN